jgi:pseudoazurin
MSKLNGVMVAVAAILVHCAASAEEHIVRGVVTQWKPLVTFAQPGDNIKFINMIGHDTETIEGMIPDGAQTWKSELGEEGFSVTVTNEGAYVYKCNPHLSLGMVGVIVVGDANPPANMEALEANLENISVGKNMVNRAIKKLKKALEAKAQ